jgi:hypothetical protein
MGVSYTCYDCGKYDYENECCISYDYVDLDDGACEDFIPISDYEYELLDRDDCVD